MIDNRLGSGFCPYCRNTGQVVAEKYRQRKYLSDEETELVEVMGPCQGCTLGSQMEFPGPDKNGKPQVGHWGEQGFWRGRKMEVVAEDETYLSREENAKRWRALGLSTGLILDEVEA